MAWKGVGSGLDGGPNEVGRRLIVHLSTGLRHSECRSIFFVLNWIFFVSPVYVNASAVRLYGYYFRTYFDFGKFSSRSKSTES